MEQQQNQPPQKQPNQERKSPPMGRNLIWYFLAARAISLLLVNFSTSESPLEIPIGRFLELVEKGGPGKQAAAQSTVLCRCPRGE